MSKPEFQHDEEEIESHRANRTQAWWRAVGGQLMLTNQRLIFSPHKFDGATGGNQWECPLDAISGVATAARGFNPLNGSLRPRLQVDSSGTSERFVVTNVDSVIAAIETARGNA
jgi:hypothetical protein